MYGLSLGETDDEEALAVAELRVWGLGFGVWGLGFRV